MNYLQALLLGAVIALSAFSRAEPAAASEFSLACGSGSLLALTDGASGTPSACTARRGEFLVESLYFQNASAVGGTALAAYPMFRLRAGVLPRLELLLDTPSQVAESGLGGVGLYLMSNPGFGAKFSAVDSGRLAISIGAEVEPPVNQYSPHRELQPKYSLDATWLYQVTPRFALTGLVGASTSRKVGLAHVFPGATVGAKIHADHLTDVSFDVGSRFIARQAQAQAFGDVSVERLLSRRLSFAVGLGTSFNPVVETKSHYLAAGFNYRP